MYDLTSVVTGAGPALLLVHGAGGSIRSNYGPVLVPLSRHFTVIAPDLPGSGRSPVADGPLDLDALADELVDIAVAAGHESFHVCGYSMGCAVAVATAVRHPGRVRGLVLSAPFTSVDATTKTLVDRWLALLDGSRDELARFILSIMCSERYLARLRPSDLEAFLQLAAATVAPGTASHVDLVRRVDLAPLLERVDRPTLVIGATEDRLLTPGLAEQVADLVPGAKYADLACGHAIALEAAAPWAALITEFLTSAPS
ncbi:Pimeloyl-ACP methyl ester carboxylesterase [Lentzea fradiae]|uniref:Pimeloyl-ACP methyl ester carboxylesterase n=1 Tax=Lentzea fradiae TaxID=200378 RepID=A0A1G7QC49_9PSEU|nr:alpha/beta fold hydrolase [Lentzea fradiae]SDF95170.1 Pimeloyl-ACP methyl ester carboxylesterase [Lentzea fradiae]